LILPCEVAVKSAIPAIKALMAKELVEQHGLKQDQVAEILGISQSAVSKYSRKIRGYVIRVDNIEEIHPLVNSMIILLMNGKYRRTEFMQLFCQTCLAVRRTSLMCIFCEKSDPKIKIKGCSFCIDQVSHRK
jgi:predicted transcriptional regulator